MYWNKQMAYHDFIKNWSTTVKTSKRGTYCSLWRHGASKTIGYYRRNLQWSVKYSKAIHNGQRVCGVMKGFSLVTVLYPTISERSDVHFHRVNQRSLKQSVISGNSTKLYQSLMLKSMVWPQRNLRSGESPSKMRLKASLLRAVHLPSWSTKWTLFCSDKVSRTIDRGTCITKFIKMI